MILSEPGSSQNGMKDCLRGIDLASSSSKVECAIMFRGFVRLEDGLPQSEVPSQKAVSPQHLAS
jgi:hypothetical protein